MSKIVFLDVDGTLIDYEAKMPDSAKIAVDAARKNGYSTSDVFRAYGHGQTLPEEEAEILSSCSKLSPENRENLRIFLKSAVSIS